MKQLLWLNPVILLRYQISPESRCLTASDYLRGLRWGGRRGPSPPCTNNLQQLIPGKTDVPSIETESVHCDLSVCSTADCGIDVIPSKCMASIADTNADTIKTAYAGESSVS